MRARNPGLDGQDGDRGGRGRDDDVHHSTYRYRVRACAEQPDGHRGATGCTFHGDAVPEPAPGLRPSYGSGSYSDADFLARLNARGITTPSASTRTAGGRNVCYQLSSGSTLTAQANQLLGAPYNYWDALAGYFVGEAVKVYCPQYSSLLVS